MAGITIKAFDSDDSAATPTATTTSLADGSYTLTGLTGGAKYRLEFLWAGSWLKSGASGGTNIQFTQDGATATNFAIHDPNDYWDNTKDPHYVVPHYWNGLASANSAETGIGSIPYSSTGLNASYKDYNGNNGTGPIPRSDLMVSQVGTVWGEAYHKSQKHLYLTTFLKRHSGMTDTPGYIYNVDYSGATPSLAGKFDLQGVTPSNGGSPIDLGTVTRSGSADFTLSSSKSTPSRDINAFGKVGAMSYGDADIQPGTDYLWTVNLYQQALIRVDVSGNPTSVPSDVRQYILNTLPGYPTSSTGILRPWGLTFAHGKGYLGVVDDASISTLQANLKAIVLEFDPDNITAGFTQKLSFDPNLKRQIAGSWIPFFPWINTYAEPPVTVNGGYYYRPQPVLSDMEFDEFGNMYVSFFDRWGHQMGYWNYRPISGTTNTVRPAVYGEILKACGTASGWEIEGTGTCHTGTTEFIQDISGDNERESSEGAVALLKGKNQLLQVSIDPHPQGTVNSTYWTTQGANTYNLSNGQISNWYSFFQSGTVETYGKANGLGDVELIVPPAPTEIGNRVWLDTDSDGVQDADENGVPNVVVELRSGAMVLATATTAADGTYYFSNAVGTNTASKKYGLVQLQPNTAYTIKFPTTVTVSGTTYNLTTALTGGNTQIDSNAVATGDVAILAADIPVAGANNHSFDVGYSAAPACSINTPTVTSTCDNNGTPSNPADDKFTYKVTATGTNVGATYSVSGGDTYANRSYGTEHTSVNSFLISGGNLTLTLTDDTTATCKLDNVIVNAPNTCSSTVPTGNLTITKTVTGGTDPQTFNLQLDCSDNTFDDNAIVLTAGATHTANNIPAGTTCAVTETAPTAPIGYTYNTPAITPAQPVTIVANTTVAVSVLNAMTKNCSINAPTVTSTCNNNGTPSNTSDDKFTYKITATGSNVGATYSITGGDTYANRSYGTEHTSTNSFPISGGNLALTLTDDTTASCTLSNITVTAPATCSSSQPATDLSLKKTVDKKVVQKGDTLVYTITVTNAGPDAATGVEVKDKLPTALSYVSDDGQAVYGSDVYDDVTGIWQVGSLAKDESKSLKITAKVN